MPITRRTALTALALPALPSAALARQAEPDPSVPAFEAWRQAHLQHVATCTEDHTDEETWAACDVVTEALDRLSRIRATTPQGIRGQLIAVLYAMSENGVTVMDDDPLTWTPDDFGNGGSTHGAMGDALVWRLIETAEAMAARGA